MDLNYIGGLRSKIEAEKIRELLIKRYRPWFPGGLEMVSKSLTVKRTPEMNRTKTDSYPWRIVHAPQVRQIETMSGAKTDGVWDMSEQGKVDAPWQIENFSERALEFYQGYVLGRQEGRASKGRKKNARNR
jgi:hypothetical protein